jgi:endo-1,4-beta-xylanase
MKRTFIKFVLFVVLCNGIQTEAITQNAPVVLEAESAILGSEYKISEEGGVTYISSTTTGLGENPQSSARIASFSVPFDFAQNYDLYVRVRVGELEANDDSFFYGNGFGEKSVTDNDAWIIANELAKIGYSQPQAFVLSEGNAGINIWKWINLSEFNGGEVPISFSVAETNGSLIFQIGAREDGFDIDKIAFARADYFYTVKNLENGEAGSPDMTGPTQDPIAKGNQKFLGNIWSPSQAPGFLNYWNQVTPENAGKWGSVEATRDNMNWSNLDKAYALAKENGLIFRFHILVWGNQQPSWIENLSQEEQLAEIKEWFQAVAQRYPDIDYLEVVNEALHDPPNAAGNGGGNYINALGGTGVTGYDWILESFRLAKENFPNAKLCINDYNIIGDGANVTKYINIINLLKAENLIDAIGFQAHAFSTTGNTSTMKNNLDRLAETGLPLFASELDIDGPTDDIQLADYQKIFPVIWEHPGVIGVTLWGYKPGLWRNEQRAYLIDTDGVTERPALQWLREYVEGTTTSTYLTLSKDDIIIYPNPLNNGTELFIKGIEEDLKMVEIYSLDGRKLFSAVPDTNRVSFHSKVPGGIYLLRMIGKTRDITKRIIIK